GLHYQGGRAAADAARHQADDAGRHAGEVTAPTRRRTNTPSATLAIENHCAVVRPSSQAGLRRGDTTSNPAAAGEDRESPEQMPGGQTAAALAPQNDEGHHVEHQLVERRRMDALRSRHHAVWIAHGPRQISRHTVVPVTGELAADAPDRETDGERRRSDVRR